MKKDNGLSDALIKSYIARAKLFYNILKKKNIPEMFARVEDCASKTVHWNLSDLGIAQEAFSIIERAGVRPAHVFCHPEIVEECPDTLDYYRNLCALSQKGLSQMLRSRQSTVGGDQDRLRLTAETLNYLISHIIMDIDGFSLSAAREALVAEIGTEIQGRWVNIIGRGASRAIEGIIYEYAHNKGFIETKGKRAVASRKGMHKQVKLVLKNGWSIVFGSEPDVAVRNSQNRLEVAIEIKGSMDVAGAQTRLGEAKKSFAKAKSENAHCWTVYLASCFTDAVLLQLKFDREIDSHFNLVDILADEEKKRIFLRELFHYKIRIK